MKAAVRRELARIESDVALCDRCFGIEPRAVVRFDRPGPEPRVLVLGERAPRAVLDDGERLGVGHADPGTRFLRAMLEVAGIPEEEVVVGAATLCRPRETALERAVPASARLKSCAPHVRHLVRVVAPRLVLPLGATALRSLRAAFPAEPALRSVRFPGSVGTTTAAGGVWIRPLYHTTTRARVTRPAERQRDDWREVGRLWRWIAAGERGAPPHDDEADAAAGEAASIRSGPRGPPTARRALPCA